MKMPGNMQAMMQQAQKMQQKMQEEVALIRVEGSAGGGMVTIKIGDAAPGPPVAPAPKREDEATARALAHPVVKRFQDVFEDAQVRTVRNLKDT